MDAEEFSNQLSAGIAEALFGARPKEESMSLAPTKRKTPPPAKPAAGKPKCRSCGCAIAEGGNGLCCECDPDVGDHLTGMARQYTGQVFGRLNLPAEEPAVQTCRQCGCTHEDACWSDELGESCSWAEPDLCTACQRINVGTDACDDWDQPSSELRQAMPRPSLAAAGRGLKPTTTNGKPPEGGTPAAVGKFARLPLVLLARNRFNPRKLFDAAELAQIADSLQEHGQIGPITVRPIAARGGLPSMINAKLSADYEIVAGERRTLAAVQAGWTEIDCVVRDLDDKAACEIAVIENLERKDLSDVELAFGFDQLVKQGYTVTAIAGRLKRSQPYVSNVLRLLDLPETWKQRIISQEMTPTHARCVLPWLAYPQILTAIETAYKREFKEGMPTVSSWEDDVKRAVHANTYRIADKHSYDYEMHVNLSVEIKATDDERAALGIIDVPMWGSVVEPRATNKALHAKLWAKALKEARQKAVAKDKGSKGKAAKQTAKPPTAAQLRAKAEEQQRLYQRRLATWRIDWLQFLCAKYVEIDSAQRLLVYCAGEGDAPGEGNWESSRRIKARHDVLVDYLEAATKGKVPRQREKYGSDRAKTWHPIAGVDDIDSLAVGFGKRLLWNEVEKVPACLLPDYVIEDLSAYLEIDLADEWRQAKAGPLTQRFLELHSREQLTDLGAELKTYIAPKHTKTAAIKLIMTQTIATSLPKCLQPAKSAAAKRKAK